MQPSMFNVQVPLADRHQVFLMNTFTDAQIVVSDDVASLLDRLADGTTGLTPEEREAAAVLADHGFLVETREAERRALDEYLVNLREDREQLRVTVLTTLQCNFACDYCFQGDHGDYNASAAKMTRETAEAVVAWIAQRLDEVRPERFVLTLFGGEPLLNLPVAYLLAERCHALCEARGIPQTISLITNALLLTPEVVHRLMPFGLGGIKVTLDGDRDTHNRLRPLRGRQGTFDRIIQNVRRVAHLVPITIGGNFDESSWESYPALLDFLGEQEFAEHIAKVNFKPIIRAPEPEAPQGLIPLTAVGANGQPLGGTCMTSAGAGRGITGGGMTAGGACDSCHFVDERMTFLREETRRRGFPTPDGVHMGPCEIHRRHAYSIGPDGGLYACPGFTGEASASTGHIDGRDDGWRRAAAARFARLSARKEACGECAFIPVCGGGCSVAAHTEQGDMHSPSCHKGALEAALTSLAERSVAAL